MLPLQSAEPRPYQRPSRSVSSHTGDCPRVLAERRLDVVVAVEQHRRRALRARRVAVHRLAAVGRRRRGDVLQPDLGERVDHPLRGLLALLGRVLLGVGDRPERDELGEVVLRAAHEAARPPGADRRSASRSVLDHVVELEVVDRLAELLDLLRAVRLEDQHLAEHDAAVGDDRPPADVRGAVGELVEEDRLGQPVVASSAVSQTAPPSSPSVRTMMSWSGARQPGLLELLRELLRPSARPRSVSFSPV